MYVFDTIEKTMICRAICERSADNKKDNHANFTDYAM